MGSSPARLIVSILVVVGLAIGFWTLVISPKRSEADKLGQEIQQLSASVETARSEVATAAAAKQGFPDDYRQLVVLGQAAPAGDETASLLVELEGIADSTGVSFDSIQLEGSGEEVAAAPVAAPEATPEAASPGSSGAVNAAASVSPTELSASLLPLGASIGPAGLYVMPYGLQFSGDYFEIADFIHRVDALVRPGDQGIEVDGRLITISGFTLATNGEGEGGESSAAGEAELTASLTVTTYLSPPSQGITAGATPTAPAPVTPEATGSTSEPAASAASTETVAPASETVSAK